MSMQLDQEIILAVPKGRVLKEVLPLLARMGVEPEESLTSSRKLLFSTNVDKLKLLIVRATDAPVYVREGAADIGIVGKDVMLEEGAEGLGEYLDLAIAPCRLCLASTGAVPDPATKIRIATKYVNVAQKWFAEKGQPIELIKLYGSMELAPLVGLADFIVDLVETGNTLKANGLKVVQDLMPISSRVIFNPIAKKTKHQSMEVVLSHFTKHK